MATQRYAALFMVKHHGLQDRTDKVVVCSFFLVNKDDDSLIKRPFLSKFALIFQFFEDSCLTCHLFQIPS